MLSFPIQDFTAILRSLRFAMDLLQRGAQEWFSSMGTTGLAVAIGYSQPLYRLIVIWLRKGTHAMKAHLKETAKNGALITIAFWILLFGYDVVYKVPHGIRTEANNLASPSLKWKPHPPSMPPLKPNSQHPIEVSFNCDIEIFPIKVPPGNILYVLPLNLALLLQSPWVQFAGGINNISGEDTKLWPDPKIIEEARKKGDQGTSGWRCDVTNHGQDNVLNLQIPLKISNRHTSSWHLSTLMINPLDHGKTFTFHIVNDCPFQAQILTPKFGKANVAGEQAIREFQIEVENPEIMQWLGVSESKTNWTVNSCPQ